MKQNTNEEREKTEEVLFSGTERDNTNADSETNGMEFSVKAKSFIPRLKGQATDSKHEENAQENVPSDKLQAKPLSDSLPEFIPKFKKNAHISEFKPQQPRLLRTTQGKAIDDMKISTFVPKSKEVNSTPIKFSEFIPKREKERNIRAAAEKALELMTHGDGIDQQMEGLNFFSTIDTSSLESVIFPSLPVENSFITTLKQALIKSSPSTRHQNFTVLSKKGVENGLTLLSLKKILNERTNTIPKDNETSSITIQTNHINICRPRKNNGEGRNEQKNETKKADNAPIKENDRESSIYSNASPLKLLLSSLLLAHQEGIFNDKSTSDEFTVLVNLASKETTIDNLLKEFYCLYHISIKYPQKQEEAECTVQQYDALIKSCLSLVTPQVSSLLSKLLNSIFLNQKVKGSFHITETPLNPEDKYFEAKIIFLLGIMNPLDRDQIVPPSPSTWFLEQYHSLFPQSGEMLCRLATEWNINDNIIKHIYRFAEENAEQFKEFISTFSKKESKMQILALELATRLTKIHPELSPHLEMSVTKKMKRILLDLNRRNKNRVMITKGQNTTEDNGKPNEQSTTESENSIPLFSFSSKKGNDNQISIPLNLTEKEYISRLLLFLVIVANRDNISRKLEQIKESIDDTNKSDNTKEENVLDTESAVQQRKEIIISFSPPEETMQPEGTDKSDKVLSKNYFNETNQDRKNKQERKKNQTREIHKIDETTTFWATWKQFLSEVRRISRGRGATLSWDSGILRIALSALRDYTSRSPLVYLKIGSSVGTVKTFSDVLNTISDSMTHFIIKNQEDVVALHLSVLTVWGTTNRECTIRAVNAHVPIPFYRGGSILMCLFDTCGRRVGDQQNERQTQNNALPITQMQESYDTETASREYKIPMDEQNDISFMKFVNTLVQFDDELENRANDKVALINTCRINPAQKQEGKTVANTIRQSPFKKNFPLAALLETADCLFYNILSNIDGVCDIEIGYTTDDNDKSETTEINKKVASANDLSESRVLRWWWTILNNCRGVKKDIEATMTLKGPNDQQNNLPISQENQVSSDHTAVKTNRHTKKSHSAKSEGIFSVKSPITCIISPPIFAGMYEERLGNWKYAREYYNSIANRKVDINQSKSSSKAIKTTPQERDQSEISTESTFNELNEKTYVNLLAKEYEKVAVPSSIRAESEKRAKLCRVIELVEQIIDKPIVERELQKIPFIDQTNVQCKQESLTPNLLAKDEIEESNNLENWESTSLCYIANKILGKPATEIEKTSFELRKFFEELGYFRECIATDFDTAVKWVADATALCNTETGKYSVIKKLLGEACDNFIDGKERVDNTTRFKSRLLSPSIGSAASICFGFAKRSQLLILNAKNDTDLDQYRVQNPVSSFLNELSCSKQGLTEPQRDLIDTLSIAASFSSKSGTELLTISTETLKKNKVFSSCELENAIRDSRELREFPIAKIAFAQYLLQNSEPMLAKKEEEKYKGSSIVDAVKQNIFYCTRISKHTIKEDDIGTMINNLTAATEDEKLSIKKNVKQRLNAILSPITQALSLFDEANQYERNISTFKLRYDIPLLFLQMASLVSIDELELGTVVRRFLSETSQWRNWIKLVPQLLSRIATLPPSRPAVSALLEALLKVIRSSPQNANFDVTAFLRTRQGLPYKEKLYAAFFKEKAFSKSVADTSSLFEELQKLGFTIDDQWNECLSNVNRILLLYKDTTTEAIISPTIDQINGKLILGEPTTFAKQKEIILNEMHELWNKTTLTQTDYERRFIAAYGQQLTALIHMIERATLPLSSELFTVLDRLRRDLSKMLKIKKTEPLDSLSPSLATSTLNSVLIPGAHQDTVVSISRNVTFFGAKTRPRKIQFVTSKGKFISFLLKPDEDLHLDQRVAQLFDVLNDIISEQQHTHSLRLENDDSFHWTDVPLLDNAMIYPLGEHTGLVEWIENSTTIRSEFERWQKDKIAKLKKNGINVPSIIEKPEKHFIASVVAKTKVKSRALWDTDSLLEAYCEMTAQIPPSIVSQFLVRTASIPGDWMRNQQNYTDTLALTSAGGFFVGLGDRHLDNILLSETTGKVSHVDFNVCFSKGDSLRVPERVPFRLTRNLEAALGPALCHGRYESAFTAALSGMVTHRTSLSALLAELQRDPLIDWYEHQYGRKRSITATNRETIQILWEAFNNNARVFSKTLELSHEKIIELKRTISKIHEESKFVEQQKAVEKELETSREKFNELVEESKYHWTSLKKTLDRIASVNMLYDEFYRLVCRHNEHNKASLISASDTFSAINMTETTPAYTPPKLSHQLYGNIKVSPSAFNQLTTVPRIHESQTLMGNSLVLVFEQLTANMTAAKTTCEAQLKKINETLEPFINEQTHLTNVLHSLRDWSTKVQIQQEISLPNLSLQQEWLQGKKQVSTESLKVSSLSQPIDKSTPNEELLLLCKEVEKLVPLFVSMIDMFVDFQMINTSFYRVEKILQQNTKISQTFVTGEMTRRENFCTTFSKAFDNFLLSVLAEICVALPFAPALSKQARIISTTLNSAKTSPWFSNIEYNNTHTLSRYTGLSQLLKEYDSLILCCLFEPFQFAEEILDFAQNFITTEREIKERMQNLQENSKEIIEKKYLLEQIEFNTNITLSELTDANNKVIECNKELLNFVESTLENSENPALQNIAIKWRSSQERFSVLTQQLSEVHIDKGNFEELHILNELECTFEEIETSMLKFIMELSQTHTLLETKDISKDLNELLIQLTDKRNHLQKSCECANNILSKDILSAFHSYSVLSKAEMKVQSLTEENCSNEARRLIKEAVSQENLSQMFEGWAPWV